VGGDGSERLCAGARVSSSVTQCAVGGIGTICSNCLAARCQADELACLDDW
jgi:hypothetical protein